MDLKTSLQSIFNGAEIITLLVNDDYNFSINLIKATKENPYNIIFTNGLSIKGQNTQDKHKEFKFIELYLCLPDYWKCEDQSKKNQWPIFWLNKIAQIPCKNNSWFGPGDTIPAGNPSAQLTDKLKQSYFILAEPMLLDNKLTTVNIDSKSIKFLAVMPIFEEEFKLKLKNSAKVLLTKFQLKNYNELIDEYRQPITTKLNFKLILMLGVTIVIASAVLWVVLTGGNLQKDRENTTPPQTQQSVD